LTGFTNNSTQVPTDYYLYQNYPNPFNPNTKIRFDIPKVSNVKIVVYDNIGREISILTNQVLSPGNYEIEWNASEYSSGIYFYRIITNDFIAVKKMVLLK
jgi:hypothetical protein